MLNASTEIRRDARQRLSRPGKPSDVSQTC
jgi:hypothetical protein